MDLMDLTEGEVVHGRAMTSTKVNVQGDWKISDDTGAARALSAFPDAPPVMKTETNPWTESNEEDPDRLLIVR